MSEPDLAAQVQRQVNSSLSILRSLGIACGMAEAVFLRRCITEYRQLGFESPGSDALDRYLNTYHGTSLNDLWATNQKGMPIPGQWGSLVSQDEDRFVVDPEFREYMQRKQRENELI